jgi:hypothetical protein
MKDGRSGPSPFTGIPVDGAEFVPVMAKRYGPGGLIVPHRVKGKHNLAAALRPMTLLARVVFADVQRGKNRAAVGSEIECKDTLRRIGRRRVTLVNPWHLPLRGEKRDAAGRNEPTESQQTTRKQMAPDHAE